MNLEKELINLLSNKRNYKYSNITILKAWAKEDNPEKYNIIIDNYINEIINISIYNNTYDISKMIYKFNNKNNLYEWIKCNNKYKLRNELSETLPKYLTTDESQKSIYDIKAKEAIKIALKLKQSGFKASIMRECKYLFIDNNLK